MVGASRAIPSFPALSTRTSARGSHVCDLSQKWATDFQLQSVIQGNL